MKADDLKTLKQLSRDAVDLVPRGLTTDANRYVYINGKEIGTMGLLVMINNVMEGVLDLDQVIQGIKVKKSLKNNTEEPSVDAGENG